MRLFSFSIFLFSICCHVYAEPKTGISGMVSNVGNRVVRVAAMARFQSLTPQQKAGANEYLDMIGVGASEWENPGFVDYNIRQLGMHNGCLRDLAGEFYHAIRARTGAQELGRIESATRARTLRFTTLSNRSPAAPAPNAQGWLWNDALAYANGNPAIAMQLIGLCGHDDVNALGGGENGDSFSVPTSSFSRQNARGAVGVYNRASALAPTFCPATHPPNEIVQCQRSLPLMFQQISDPEGAQSVGCPSLFGEMFVSGSLGIDIPDAAKTNLAAAQAGGNREGLKSKYYHILGQAYASCALVRNNVSIELAKRFGRIAVRAYRSQRICERVVDQHDVFLLNMTPAQVATQVQSYRARRPNEGFCKDENNVSDMRCKLEKVLTRRFLATSDDPTNAIRIARARARARDMFRRSGEYNSPDVLRCVGPQDSDGVRDYFTHRQAGRSINPCGPNLHATECADARQVMREFAADFDFDEANHMAGIDFAYRPGVCPRIAQGQSPFTTQQVCEARDRARAATPENNPFTQTGRGVTAPSSQTRQ